DGDGAELGSGAMARVRGRCEWSIAGVRLSDYLAGPAGEHCGDDDLRRGSGQVDVSAAARTVEHAAGGGGWADRQVGDAPGCDRGWDAQLRFGPDHAALEAVCGRWNPAWRSRDGAVSDCGTAGEFGFRISECGFSIVGRGREYAIRKSQSAIGAALV